MTRPLPLMALLIASGLSAQTPQAASPAAAPAGTGISLQDAIKTAIKNNLQVSIADETRNATIANEMIAAGVFDWTLKGSLSYAQEKSGFFDKTGFQTGTPGFYDSTTKSHDLAAGVVKPFVWGGTLQVSYGNPGQLGGGLYSNTTVTSGPAPSGGGAFVPYSTTPYPYSDTLIASYTQHLLQGFGRSNTGAALIVAQNGSKAADYNFQLSVINLVATTESAYWDLVFAKENLDNKQTSLKLAQKQLDENKIRVQVGTMAPIEITQAQATVAQREQDIISAEAQLANAKDVLIRALYPLEAQPASIDATDEPSVTPMSVDEPAAEQAALQSRLELRADDLSLQSQRVLEGAAKNKTLPTLDLTVGYVGASAARTSWSDVNKDIFQGSFPGYQVGLNFALPIPNRAARGALAQARANRHAAELTLKDEQLQVRLDVREAYRNVEASIKGVAAAEKTRKFQQETLDAEQKKFENGMSTNFLVLSFQNDLDAAKAAELQARITYAKAVTALEQATGHLLQARNLEIK